MSITYTSLAADLGAPDQLAYLASSSGIERNNTVINIGQEIMEVVAVQEGGVVHVRRGAAGTQALEHQEGSSVAIGAPADFASIISTQLAPQGPQTEVSPTYDGTRSFQPYAVDLNLQPGAGRSAAQGTAFLAPFMGNILGDTLTQDSNYLGGMVGAYSITGAGASIYPKGGVVGIVMDGVTDADAPVVSVLDGDGGGATTPGAMFKVRRLNSTVSNKPNYGLDLYDSTAGYTPMLYEKADIRLSNEVVFMQGAGAPVDGTTGDNFAGPGSLYIDTTNGDLYLQTSAITTPVWKLVTRAA